MKRTYRRAAALAAAATMVMTSATALSAAPAQAAVSGFVTVSNARLTLGGQPYKMSHYLISLLSSPNRLSTSR